MKSTPVCGSQLIFVDVDTEETITLGGSALTVNGANITFVTQLLRRNRHYNVTVIASNAAGSTISETRISK